MPHVFRHCLRLILFASASAFAQSEKDSLLHLIHTMPEDTSKMEIYFQYGFLMENENLDTSAHYYRKAEAISEQYRHIKGKIKFIHNYSFVLNLQGRLDEAYVLNREAVLLARKHNLLLEAAKSLTNLGNNHNFKGEYDSAIRYYIESAGLFEKTGVTQHLPILYQNIGVAFDAMAQYEKGIEYALKSAESARQLGDSITMVSALNNMASSLSSLDLWDSALVVLKKTLATSKSIQYTHGAQASLTNIGDIYAQKRNYTLAGDAFRESLKLARRISFPGGQASALNGLAYVAFKQGEFEEADRFAAEAMNISEKESTGVFTDLRQQYKLLADIKANLGQTKAAYNYLQKYVTLNDSLSGMDVKKMTADLERKYQLAQKDKAIAQKDLEVQQAGADVRQKNTQLVIVIASLLFVLIILFLLYRFFRQRQRLQQQQVHALQQEQEVIRLRSNLEGQQEERMRIAKEIHDDIGSGLTSLVFLTSSLPEVAETNGVKDKITGIARQMVGQMNEIVWSLNSDQDSLEDLVIYIRHSISEMLDTVEMDYEFRIPEGIPPVHLTGAQRRHIFLVLKEAVHNSIKHAKATRVVISVSFTDTIHITIEDNGRGISGAKTNGNGLKNMQYRMKQLGGEWKLLSTEPVKIELTVPLAQAV